MAWSRASKLGWAKFVVKLGNPHPPAASVSCGDQYWTAGIFSRLKRSRKVLMGTLALGGAASVASTTAYLGTHLETVPYSKSTHLLLIPRQVSKVQADFLVDNFIKEHGCKIWPSEHPSSARLKFIAQKLIDAMQEGLLDDTNWGAPNYASRYAAQYLEHINWPCTTLYN